MYLLDTDHITLLKRGGEEGECLHVRLASVSTEEALATTYYGSRSSAMVETTRCCTWHASHSLAPGQEAVTNVMPGASNPDVLSAWPTS
jgi:hypothetical protein